MDSEVESQKLSLRNLPKINKPWYFPPGLEPSPIYALPSGAMESPVYMNWFITLSPPSRQVL